MTRITRISGTVIVLVFVVLLCIRLDRNESTWALAESIIISIVTGLIAGFVANILSAEHQRTSKDKQLKRELQKFVGSYLVYHAGQLETPDIYRVTIEETNGSLRIRQTGKIDDHILEADVKINELTFTHGEGNYIHPRKEGRPTGRMELYFVEPGTINVDKYFLYVKNNSEFIPGWEKWQWRTNNTR